MADKADIQKDSISLAAVGDILMGVQIVESDGTLHEPLRKDPKSAFKFVAPIVKKADIGFFNLEAPLSYKGKVPKGKAHGWRSSPDMAAIISSAGFNIASVANNHITDFGAEALMDTLEQLAKNNIAYVGAGRNISEARKPLILERKGARIGFIGYCSNVGLRPQAAASDKRPGIAVVRVSPLYASPQINEESLELMVEDIQKTRSSADLAILSFHTSLSLTKEGGGSHTLGVHQVGAAHAAIDAGADLVLGHGPHLLQGIEVYKGKVIFYNLGQLIVDRDVPDEYKNTIILNCEISDKKIQRVSFLPVALNEQKQPEPLTSTDERCHKINELMVKLSRKLGTTLYFEGVEGVVKTSVE